VRFFKIYLAQFVYFFKICSAIFVRFFKICFLLFVHFFKIFKAVQGNFNAIRAKGRGLCSFISSVLAAVICPVTFPMTVFSN